MTDLLLLLSWIAVNVVAGTLLLRYGAALVRLRPASLLQAGLAVLLATVAIVVFSAASWWLVRRGAVAWYFAVPAVAILLPLANLLALRLAHYRSWWELFRGLVLIALGWGVGLEGYGMALLLALMQGFAIPTNGMAPTIVGRHFRGTCQDCGAETIIGARDTEGGIEPVAEGICTRCYRFGPTATKSNSPSSSDRIFVRRWAAPHRWDVIVFQFPPNPKQLYVQRLVGLPGETIEIREGAIWINGSKLRPPPEIAGLRWDLPDGGVPFGESFAVEGKSLTLDNDQYFTLGDNSQSSYDSRFWGAVPAKNLIGRAALVYFPPRGWKSLPSHD